MTRAVAASGLLLMLLGCEELGNPAPYRVFDDHGLLLRSRMRTAPAEAASGLTAGLPPDALDHADPQPTTGGYVALVRVDVTGLSVPPASPLRLETVFALDNGQRVARRWTTRGSRSTHLALFALPSRPLELVTHVP